MDPGTFAGTDNGAKIPDISNFIQDEQQRVFSLFIYPGQQVFQPEKCNG